MIVLYRPLTNRQTFTLSAASAAERSTGATPAPGPGPEPSTVPKKQPKAKKSAGAGSSSASKKGRKQKDIEAELKLQLNRGHLTAYVSNLMPQICLNKPLTVLLTIYRIRMNTVYCKHSFSHELTEHRAGAIDMESVRSAKSARNVTQRALADETPLASTSAFLPPTSARLLTPAPPGAATALSARESARLEAAGEAYASALKDLLLLDARGAPGAPPEEAASASLTGRASGSRPPSARRSARSRPGSAVAAATPATNKYYLSNKGLQMQTRSLLWPAANSLCI